jgi:hypothetical protein
MPANMAGMVFMIDIKQGRITEKKTTKISNNTSFLSTSTVPSDATDCVTSD